MQCTHTCPHLCMCPSFCLSEPNCGRREEKGACTDEQEEALPVCLTESRGPTGSLDTGTGNGQMLTLNRRLSLHGKKIFDFKKKKKTKKEGRQDG